MVVREQEAAEICSRADRQVLIPKCCQQRRRAAARACRRPDLSSRSNSGLPTTPTTSGRGPRHRRRCLYIFYCVPVSRRRKKKHIPCFPVRYDHSSDVRSMLLSACTPSYVLDYSLDFFQGSSGAGAVASNPIKSRTGRPKQFPSTEHQGQCYK